MKYFFLACCLLSFSLVWGQNYRIKGSVLDSATGKPLEYATVTLLNPQDSSLVSFGRSKENGDFQLNNVEKGEYRLAVSFVGFQTWTKNITLNGPQLTFQADTIRLHPGSQLLSEVEVKGEQMPVTIKKDTIEFNAGSFKTRPNAVVEDLLKKLPGVQVEKDGNIKAQGEKVEKVLVDGKPFFGNDPKVATRNLPADAVNKVQIFDKKSDKAEFTGLEDGEKQKTINLKLREDRKNGIFGNAMAGGGIPEQFDSKLSLNRFTKKQQLSLIGMGNNINKQGFTIDDYMNYSGQLQKAMTGGGAIRLEINPESLGLPLDFGNNSGITKTFAGGLNYNDEWNKKAEANASLFSSFTDKRDEKTALRQNFLPDRTFTSSSTAKQDNASQSHRINTALDFKPDSLQSIKWTTTLSYLNNRLDSDTRSASAGGSGQPDNTSTRTNTSESDSYRLNTSLLYRKKLSKKGRSFTAETRLGLTSSDREGSVQALNEFFAPANTLLRSDTIRQRSAQDNNELSYGATLSFTEPLWKRRFLEASYTYSHNNNRSSRDVNDYNPESRQYDRYNALLSNRFDNLYDYHRGGLTFFAKEKKYNYSLGVFAQQSRLDGRILSRDTSVKRTFANLLPVARLNYSFSMMRNLNLDYTTDLREPSLSELQPVPDNTDPLNIYTGNPALLPEYNHRLNLRYNSFDQETFRSFFAFAGVTLTQNKIANSESVSNLLARSSTPVNVDGAWNANANLSWGFRIKKLDSRINVTSRGLYLRDLAFVNQVKNTTDRVTLGSELRYDYAYKEKFDVSVGADLSYTSARYSFRPSQNQDFLTQQYSVDANLELPWGMAVSSDFTYFFNTGRADGFNQNYPLWNASLRKTLLKNKQGELKLTVFDLLNRNLSVTRNTTLNFVEDSRSLVLGQYFMLTFTYNIRGGAMAGMPGMPRMRMNRMIRRVG